MQREHPETSRNLENQGNITLPNDQNNLLIVGPKDMEICNLPNKELKVVVLNKLN